MRKSHFPDFLTFEGALVNEYGDFVLTPANASLRGIETMRRRFSAAGDQLSDSLKCT